jgi:hypothetical protein
MAVGHALGPHRLIPLENPAYAPGAPVAAPMTQSESAAGVRPQRLTLHARRRQGIPLS